MSDGKFSVFDFAPKVVEKKSRYRDEEQRSKLTYNFVTDPKMKRGHNFGVVYVTNSNIDEEAIHQAKKKDPIAKATDTTVDIKKKRNLEIEVPRPPKGRENLGVNTSPVSSTIRPKPLTFEMGVQIDLYIDRPQTPLFWPQKMGIDKETQIVDGELFHFDDEVEPILNVLLSKVLEGSRMEVLEEEEIKEMKKKQREFEEIRNRELTEVQKLEDKESRELAEKNRRVAQKKLEKENRIIYQKKLFARQCANEYLFKLKLHCLKHLEERGVLRNPLSNQYQNNLLNHIYKNAEEIKSNDFVVVNKLNGTFFSDFENRKKKMHLDAMEEHKRKKMEAARLREEEAERKRQEKIARALEAARKKREKELAILKNSIDEEFISKSEFVELPENVYNINAYSQKKSYAGALGGYFTQFAFIISYFNKLQSEFMNEEKLMKMLEMYIPRCPTFNIPYKIEDFDIYKTMDPSGTLTTIEDLVKLEEPLYAEIFKQITDKLFENDDMLKLSIEYISSIEGYETIKEDFGLVMNCLMKHLKSTEATIAEKIKFLLKDPTVVDDNNYLAITEIYPVSIPLQKPVDINSAANKRASKAPQKPAKAIFEPYFQERTAIFPTISEKGKILAVNYPFERMLRSNILDCMFKISKFDVEMDSIKDQFEEFYMTKFAEPFVAELVENLKKDKITFEDVAPKEKENPTI